MMTLRKLRAILNDPALNADAPVMLAGVGGKLTPLGRYGEKRMATSGRYAGGLVPYDDTTDEYDEEDGEDSLAVLVLWPER